MGSIILKICANLWQKNNHHSGNSCNSWLKETQSVSICGQKIIIIRVLRVLRGFYSQ
ncbi:hypothetical protein JOD20_004904 [Herpetosiphon giganteus]|nr:hypothetical protein [Herpetosiphon giganteus]